MAAIIPAREILDSRSVQRLEGCWDPSRPTSPVRGVATSNHLFRLESDLGQNAKYAGWTALKHAAKGSGRHSTARLSLATRARLEYS